MKDARARKVDLLLGQMRTVSSFNVSNCTVRIGVEAAHIKRRVVSPYDGGTHR